MAREERLGTCVHQKDNEYKVFAVVESDVNSKRVGVNLYVEYADGSVSDIYSMARKDVVKKMNSFDNIFGNIEGNFGDDDIAKIKQEVEKLVVASDKSDSSVYTVTQNRATLEEILERICKFIFEKMIDNKKESESENKKEIRKVFFKEKYGCMETSFMDDFLKCNKDLGYKRIELLKRLKIMGLLKVSNNRPYDYLESIGNEKVHVYKIDLSDVIETIVKAPEETTEIEESEVTEDGNQTV